MCLPQPKMTVFVPRGDISRENSPHTELFVNGTRLGAPLRCDPSHPVARMSKVEIQMTKE